MIVGSVKEIKNNENRVGLAPAGTRELVKAGHAVLMQKGSGIGSGFLDSDYLEAGAKICSTAAEVWKKSGLIVKVKEPMEQEFDSVRSGQIIFTYFHFASNKALLEEMLKRKAVCIAYETVGDDLKHPLLVPMSEVAGKMAPLVGGYYLAKFAGGKGLLLSGASGVKPAVVAILGSGIVGSNAAKVAIGMGASVVLFVRFENEIPVFQEKFPNATVLQSTPENISKIVPTADLLVGAVYATGRRAPVLVSKELVQKMQKGSVIVDIAIDQGGCVETSKPTTHSNPVFEKFGVIHYCVANMPGAFPRTATLALTNATIPFILKIANNGLKELKQDSALLNGLTTINGKLVNQNVAKTFEKKFESPLELL